MNRALTLALSPFGILYGAAMKRRRALYRSGRFRIYRTGRPLISVGNLTLGGTGKTPLVEWIAKDLARAGQRVCILSRGYGRRNAGTRVIVSDGHKLIGDAREAGDEPMLLAESLQGRAAVISDADRVSAAGWAIQNLKSDVFILDDGFQHLRVARDLNILTIDVTNPWGNGKVFPAGILREARAELARANCIVLTRADDPIPTEALRREVAGHAPGCAIFSSRMRSKGLRAIQPGQMIASPSEIKSSPASAFCGLGNPESFFALLQRGGHQLVHRSVFRDHYLYTQSDIDEIVRDSAARGAQVLLTTAKDEVKLRSFKFGLPCYAVDIAIEIDNQDELSALIAAATQKAV